MGLSHFLIEWYSINKRDLPWRHTSDPYRIWVSEVILQQTRVAQGLSYYICFTDKFPTLKSLALADIDSILKVWQGLGYYTRARNMHATAKFILEELNGEFPTTYSELLKLRGIGDYTASAIAAFAFNEAVAAVDGNVYRIISRLFGIATPIDTAKGKKELHAIAQSLLDSERPALYNQAIMDFGGTVCTPKNPSCYKCPVMEMCVAFRNRQVDSLPVKSKKIKQSERFFTYIIPERDGKTFIGKRVGSDIWHSLYEFPLIETAQPTSIEELVLLPQWEAMFGGSRVDVLHVSGQIKHILSHLKIFARFVVVAVDSQSEVPFAGYQQVAIDEVNTYSTPRLIESYLAAEPVEKYFRKDGP